MARCALAAFEDKQQLPLELGASTEKVYFGTMRVRSRTLCLLVRQDYICAADVHIATNGAYDHGKLISKYEHVKYK